MTAMARYSSRCALLVVVFGLAVAAGNEWKPVVARSFAETKPWREGQEIRRSDPATPDIVAADADAVKEEQDATSNRSARYVNLDTNEIDTGNLGETKANKDDPSNIIQGIFTDCVPQLSLTCVQKKVTIFMSRLGRMERFGLIGDFLYVVRTAKEVEPEVKEEDLKDDDDMEKVAERFFREHVVRMTLPSWSDEAGVESRAGTTLDISLPQQTTAVEEGRKKKKGGKMMKKLLMMLGMAAAAKMALMIPLGLMIIKIKAVKALIIGKLALAISKFLLIKKLLMSKKGGGGGGHGEKHIILVHSDGHGGGGGGGHGHGDSYGGPSGGGGGGGYSGGGGSYGGGGGGHGGGDSGWSSGGGGGGGGGSSGWSGGGGGGGGGGGWGRSTRSVDTHRIAYRGQKPAQ